MNIATSQVKSLALGVLTVLLIGCASSTPEPAETTAPAPAASSEEDTITFDQRVAKLKLGMSKTRVAAIMDDEGQSLHKSLSAQGAVETVSYTPNFGQRYATALKLQFSLGFAGRSDPNGAVLTFTNGRLSSISSH